jgi:ankyrin repeat protein
MTDEMMDEDWPDLGRLHLACFGGDLARVKHLVEAGRDINAVEDMGTTPLHHAAEHDYREIAVFLLDRGAEVNVFDELGKTPLHLAAKEGHHEIVTLLLSHGADVNAHLERVIGNTALSDIAGSCSLRMVQQLLDAGADPRIRGWMQLNALDRASRLKRVEGKRVYSLLLKAAGRLSG